MMDRLPHDVILEILSRLPITTLVQSKSVCRSWRSIIGGSLLANKHLLHMAENDPCIIFQSHSLIQNQYYFVDFAAFSEGNKSLKKIQASTILHKSTFAIHKSAFFGKLMHATLVGSSNGLLCFDNISQIHTCNPLTGDLVELPKLARNPGELGILGFGFSPTKKEYKVVEIAYQRRRFRTESYHPASNSFQPWVRILTLGGSQWRSLGMVSYKFVRPISQVIVSGRLHWITQPGIIMNNRVISFDLTAEQFQEVPQPDYGTLNKQFYELVVLRGHLCAAVPNASLGLDIWVMKEYNVKESWVKEFIIGGSLPEEIHSIPATRSEFRAVCRFRSGEILLEHRSKSFFLYDPVNEKFENLVLKGVPNWSKTVVHVGSLVSI